MFPYILQKYRVKAVCVIEMWLNLNEHVIQNIYVSFSEG